MVGQSLIQLLGDVGHRGMQELKSLIQAQVKSVKGACFSGRVVRLHDRFYCLKVNICELLLPEVVQSINHVTKFVVSEMLICALYQLVQFSEDPLVCETQLVAFDTVL